MDNQNLEPQQNPMSQQPVSEQLVVPQPMPQVPQLPVQPQPSEIPPSSSSSKMVWYLLIILLVLLLVGSLYFLWNKSLRLKTTTQQPTLMPRPTVQPTIMVPRSKALGFITNVVTASSLDATGSAVLPVSSFSASTKTIYLVVSLQNTKIGTKIEYVRYLDNKYLDSSSLKIVNQNAKIASFSWSLSKPSVMHIAGSYRVRVYANGIFEKEITYTISS